MGHGATAASSWLALLCLTSPPALGLRDGDMSSKAGNVSTTTESQTAQSASVSQEFGDVSQYRELNAIGTGEPDQLSKLSISSVSAGLGSCLLLCHFL